MSSFTEFHLDPALQRGIADLGFTTPTPIQIAALPPGLAGRDVLACAMTGSGKTAAFVLPILQRLITHPGRGPRALVVTPTRELAAQVHEHLEALGRHTRIVGSMRTRPLVVSKVAGADSVAGSVSVPKATMCWPTDNALASSAVPGWPLLSTVVPCPTSSSTVRRKGATRSRRTAKAPFTVRRLPLRDTMLPCTASIRSPLTLSPAMMARLMGAAPRQRGRSEA